MIGRRRWLLAGLLALIGAAYYWLLVDNRPGDARPYPLGIEQLRALAATIPGPAPSGIELELAGYRRLTGTLFVAGGGLKRRVVGIMAWRLPVEGGRPVLIDTGITPAAAQAMGIDRFEPAAQGRIEQAMDEAGLILVTHEHPDHEGALAAHGGAAWQAAALGPHQLPPAPLAMALDWARGEPPLPRFAGSEPVAVAPGVVAIPAPSHTPGAQMIYVRLADGREVLFAGDIATFDQSWRETRARSRLVGDWIAPEDRRAVFRWLLTIKALKASAPGLLVVPGHDPLALLDRQGASGIVEHFRLDPPERP